MEELSRCFPPDFFHVVHVRNALDHALQPCAAIREMLIVTRPGGTVLLRHGENEAAVQKYVGMHLWSFAVNSTFSPPHALLLFGEQKHSIDLNIEFQSQATVSVSVVSLANRSSSVDRDRYVFIELKKKR